MNTKEAKEITDSDKLVEADIEGLLQKHGYVGGLAQWPVLHEGAMCYLEAIEKTEEFIEKINRHRCVEPADCRVCIAIDEWEAEK